MPADIASVMSFLLSEDSAQITGQVIAVNAGMAMRTRRRRRLTPPSATPNHPPSAAGPFV